MSLLFYDPISLIDMMDYVIYVIVWRRSLYDHYKTSVGNDHDVWTAILLLNMCSISAMIGIAPSFFALMMNF